MLCAFLCACFPEHITPDFSEPLWQSYASRALCHNYAGYSSPVSKAKDDSHQPSAQLCPTGMEVGGYSWVLNHIWFPSKAGQKQTWNPGKGKCGSGQGPCWCGKCELVQSIFLCLPMSLIRHQGPNLNSRWMMRCITMGLAWALVPTEATPLHIEVPCSTPVSPSQGGSGQRKQVQQYKGLLKC